VLGAWGDLAERERALGIRPGQPIPLAPDGRVDPYLSAIFRHGDFARKAEGTKETYAPDYRLFFTYLWRRGLRWDEATADDRCRDRSRRVPRSRQGTLTSSARHS